ncbi:hypothetical protein HKCCE3408_17830 [Rhodobacterales bacterium HKCCE3408]|nr:hypothetical protein [Rhodobacterales bacterium HKCCE3408]
MRKIALALGLSVSICSMAAADPGILTVRTGLTGAYSAERVVSDHPHHTIMAEARILSRGPYEAYLVELGHMRDGVHRPLRMNRAVSAGRVLDFQPIGRVEDFCTGGGTCHGWRVGAIFLSREAFQRAAGQGMTVQVYGPDGTFELALPRELFSEAWNEASWLS